MNAQAAPFALTFPVTILFDCCNATWVALPYHQDDVDWPDSWNDVDDVAEFWSDMRAEPTGRGATPNDALQDLVEKLDAQGGYHVWAMPLKYRFEDTWGR